MTEFGNWEIAGKIRNDRFCSVPFQEITFVNDQEKQDGSMNMAIDEMLLRKASGLVCRFYSWRNPTVSLGYFDKIREARERYPSMEIVRRWTGGGMVEHFDDFTYSLIIPASHPAYEWTTTESYRKIHEVIAGVLKNFGNETQLAESVSPKISAGCFDSPARSDVLVQGRKIAGAAQRRTKFGTLHQGSIQGCALENGFAAALLAAFSISIHPRVLSENDFAEAKKIALGKYGTREWLEKF